MVKKVSNFNYIKETYTSSAESAKRKNSGKKPDTLELKVVVY